MPSGEVFHKIGWKELARLEKLEIKKLEEKHKNLEKKHKCKAIDLDGLLDGLR
jgi:hypothetical protein